METEDERHLEGIDTAAALEGKRVGSVQGTLWAGDVKAIYGDKLTATKFVITAVNRTALTDSRKSWTGLLWLPMFRHVGVDLNVQLLVLERREPSANMARFYVLPLEETLFGDTALVREWAASDPRASAGSTCLRRALRRAKRWRPGSA